MLSANGLPWMLEFLEPALVNACSPLPPPPLARVLSPLVLLFATCTAARNAKLNLRAAGTPVHQLVLMTAVIWPKMLLSILCLASPPPLRAPHAGLIDAMNATIWLVADGTPKQSRPKFCSKDVISKLAPQPPTVP